VEGGDIQEKALLDHFGLGEQTSMSEPSQKNEMSMILTQIGDIIDCLTNVIPSIRGCTESKLRIRTVLITSESPDVLDEHTQVVKEVLPAADDVVRERLVKSLSWRWRCLIGALDPQNIRNYPRNNKDRLS
jgi:hypothetical protein